jgi:phosphoserine phosphatase
MPSGAVPGEVRSGTGRRRLRPFGGAVRAFAFADWWCSRRPRSYSQRHCPRQVAGVSVLPMRGAVFFDVDGTLVPGTSSSQYLAGYLGHLELLRSAEDDYAEGRMDNREVSTLDAEGWQGRPESDVRRLLTDIPLVDGIPEVVAWCREHDLAVYLATLAWEPVGSYLCERFGFEGACGPRLEQAGGTYTGRVAAHFDEFDKRDFALGTVSELGLPLLACAAVGDSRSDLPLFAEVGFAVAFNASPAVQALAAASVDGADLRVVLPALASWLGNP